MNKKLVSAILCGAMVLGAATPVMAEGAGDGQKIALVGKSAGNAFFEIAANSFKETVEAEGGSVDVVYPEAATADAQIKVLDNLISQKPDAICISANDVNALQAKLEEAMDAGIKVSSFDSAPNKDSRQVFVNQAGTKQVGQALLDAEPDADALITKILHRAELEYEFCSAGDADPATMQIQKACAEYAPTEEFPETFYKEVISKVILYRDTHIEFKLQNGQIV